MIGQENLRGIGGLFAFRYDNWRIGILRHLVQAIDRSVLWPGLPAPEERSGLLEEASWPKAFTAVSSFETEDESEETPLWVQIAPNIGRRTKLRMSGRGLWCRSGNRHKAASARFFAIKTRHFQDRGKWIARHMDRSSACWRSEVRPLSGISRRDRLQGRRDRRPCPRLQSLSSDRSRW